MVMGHRAFDGESGFGLGLLIQSVSVIERTIGASSGGLNPSESSAHSSRLLVAVGWG